MTGILKESKWETLQKRRKDNTCRLILLYKGLKGKARIPIVDLIPKTGVAEINTQWPFRFPLLVKTPIRKASPQKKTIRDSKVLPDSLISSAELLDDCVSKFTSHNIISSLIPSPPPPKYFTCSTMLHVNCDALRSTMNESDTKMENEIKIPYL